MNVEQEARRLVPILVREIIEECRNKKWVSDEIWCLASELAEDHVMDALDNRVKSMLDNVKIIVES